MKLDFLEYSDDGQGIVQLMLEDTDNDIDKLEGVNLDSVDFQVDYEVLDAGKYKLTLFVGDKQAETMNMIVDFVINTSYTELLLRLKQYLESNMANYYEKIINEYKELTKPVTICNKVGEIWLIQRRDGVEFVVWIYDNYSMINMAYDYNRRLDGKYSITDIKELLDAEIEEV